MDTLLHKITIIATPASEPEAEYYIIGACNHFFLTERKELWLCQGTKVRKILNCNLRVIPKI